MIPEEAIEILNNTAWLGTDNGIKVYPAIRVAVDALEKQVPMKPKVRITKEDLWEYAEGNPTILWVVKEWCPERYREHKHYYCPECNISIEDGGIKYNYCSHCGQAIDWEGENK